MTRSITADLSEQDEALLRRAYEADGHPRAQIHRDALVVHALEILQFDRDAYYHDGEERPTPPDRLWQTGPILVTEAVCRAWCDSERERGRSIDGPAAARRELTAIAALAVPDGESGRRRHLVPAGEAESWRCGTVTLRVVREYLEDVEGEAVELAVVVSVRRVR